MENLQSDALSLLSFAGTVFIGYLIKFLASPEAKSLAAALGDRLAAETEHLVSLADHSNNALLEGAVNQLLVIAQQNKDKIGADVDSQVKYVVGKIQQNPKFANVDPSVVETLVNAMLSSYLSSVAPAAK